MPKINEANNFYWIYKIGFLIILVLPILVLSPWFFPPDFGKSIVFRSILTVLFFLFLWHFLLRKNELSLPEIKKNKIIWALSALFVVFLMASIFSVDSLFSFWGSPYRGGGFVTFIFYFIFAILSFFLFKKEDWKKAWIFSIFIGVLVSFIAIFQYYGLFNKMLTPMPSQPASTMGNPIILAIYLLLLFFPALSFAIKEPFDTARSKIKKIFYILSLVVFIFTILISGTRAAYFGIFAGIIFFLLAYPKKLKVLKIFLGLFLIFIFSFVLYANINPQLPKIFKNRITMGVIDQLSIKKALNDERFHSWQIVIEEIKDRPILGWGPENFSVGFDKNYNPLLISSLWWDKAHNIFLDTGAQAGILGIFAYIFLFIILFWQLQKIKKNKELSLIASGLQATLIGYLVANFFSFDSFGTYLIFFLIIGYSMHIVYGGTQDNTQTKEQKKSPGKYALAFVLLCISILFLWQYNILPLWINKDINAANDLANRRYCGQAVDLMGKVLPQNSFLYSYARMEYVEITKTCGSFYPENSLTYIKNSLNLISEAVKIQPLYTRYWIYLGNSTTILAGQEKNIEAKNKLFKEAGIYFDKALQLAPRHQDIIINQAKMEIAAGDYRSVQNYSEKCISLNQNLGDCYFYLALSQIYLKDSNASKNIQLALDKKYNINTKENLGQLSNAYGYVLDYKNLASTYEKLIAIDNSIAQYHSSLAFFYAKLGEYDKARKEAAFTVWLSPESKENVDAFLKTLPY